MDILTLFVVPDFGLAEIWISLLTLIFLEIVLGVDNIIFISITAAKLPEEQQARATNIGLILAMLLRVILLFGISWLIAMKAPWFYVDFWGIRGGFSGQSLILIGGGLFLLYKSVTEIHRSPDSICTLVVALKCEAEPLIDALKQRAAKTAPDGAQ